MAYPDPSGWRHRLPLAVLAAAGFLVAAYLTAFQVHAVGDVWEPIFGAGSRRILSSNVAGALPVPDASLGALGYAADFVLAFVGGTNRWREQPWLVLAFGLVVGLMALASLALIAIQIFGFGTGCSLCLTSAAISILIAVGAWPEISACLHRLRTFDGLPVADPDTARRQH